MSTYISVGAISSGNIAQITTNQYPDVAAVVVINESPFTLLVNPNDSNLYVVPAYTSDVLTMSGQYSGKINITAVADITVMGAPPVSVLYLVTYAKGEQVGGTFPAPLTRLANVGNQLSVTTTDSLINDGNSSGTQIIESTPSGGSQTWLARNDGTFEVSAIDHGTTVPMLNLIPGDATHTATLQFANGKIVFNDDDAGRITLYGSCYKAINPLGGANQFYFLIEPSDGNTYAIYQFHTDKSLVFYDLTNNKQLLKLVNGSLVTQATPTLISGVQESGHYFTQFVAPSTVAWDFWVTFKEVMTNTPTISLTGTTNVNCTVTTGGVTKYGFRLIVTPSGAGTTSCDTDWVTVAN